MKSNFNKIIKPIFFDVSLRDGLQSMKYINFDKKKKILSNIINDHKTKNIEVGSLVSSKILPQLKDSLILYQYAIKKYHNYNFYLLIPNRKYLNLAINENIKNYSLISSVSNDFQIKNTKMNLLDTKNEINYMVETINQNIVKSSIKLYLSCINYCPIAGKIDDKKILNELNYYANLNISELCLSDTCGNLQPNDFYKIINNINSNIFPRISLHLHHSNKSDLKKIINYSLEKGINKFDVSYLNSGGCSVTINGKLNPNLTYKTFSEILN